MFNVYVYCKQVHTVNDSVYIYILYAYIRTSYIYIYNCIQYKYIYMCVCVFEQCRFCQLGLKNI